MRLLEHQSKALLSRYGLRFTASHVCATTQQVEQAASALGCSAWVIKAQVPFGGRGKSGAVVFAEDVSAARSAAIRLLAMNLHGHAVREVLVEPKVAIAREFYV